MPYLSKISIFSLPAPILRTQSPTADTLTTTSYTFSVLLSLFIVFDLRKVMASYHALFFHMTQVVCSMPHLK